MESIQRMLNPIDGKREKIIELFVNYYGEEFREKITITINEITVFVAFDQESIDKFLSSIKDPVEREAARREILSSVTNPHTTDIYVTYGYKEISDTLKLEERGLSNEDKLAICDIVREMSLMRPLTFWEECEHKTPFALTAVEQLKKVGLEIDLTDQSSIAISQALDTEGILDKIFNNKLNIDLTAKIASKTMNGNVDALSMLPRDKQSELQGFATGNGLMEGRAYASQYIKNGKLVKFCALPFGASDSTILHELGHSIQTSLIGNDIKSGVEEVVAGKRHSELNEVLNDYFTMEILGACNGDTGIGTGERIPTSYSNSFPLIIPFVLKYGNKLKHAIMSNNDREIIDLLGEENYIKLNDAVKKLNKTPVLSQRLYASLSKTSYGSAALKMYNTIKSPEKMAQYTGDDKIILDCFLTAGKILNQLDKTKKQDEDFQQEEGATI